MTSYIDKCECCHKPISGQNDFKDKLSEKEFHISGMCQNCQDEVFELEDDELRLAVINLCGILEDDESSCPTCGNLRSNPKEVQIGLNEFKSC